MSDVTRLNFTSSSAIKYCESSPQNTAQKRNAEHRTLFCSESSQVRGRIRKVTRLLSLEGISKAYKGPWDIYGVTPEFIFTPRQPADALFASRALWSCDSLRS